MNLCCEGICEAEQNILPQTSLDLFLCHAPEVNDAKGMKKWMLGHEEGMKNHA